MIRHKEANSLVLALVSSTANSRVGDIVSISAFSGYRRSFTDKRSKASPEYGVGKVQSAGSTTIRME